VRHLVALIHGAGRLRAFVLPDAPDDDCVQTAGVPAVSRRLISCLDRSITILACSGFKAASAVLSM